MAYVGGSLTTLFDANQRRATETAMGDMASSAAGVWKKATEEATPVDTGELKRGWYQLPVVSMGERIQSGIASDVKYAPHVEFGTGLWGPKHAKYPILPKKPGGWLRWIDPKTGKPVFARKVMHPGSPGRYMVSKGADAVLIAITGGLFDPTLSKWEATIVANAD